MPDPDRPTNSERETTIIHTDGGGSGAVWFLIGAVVVALIIGAYFYTGGDFFAGGERSVDVDVNLPETPEQEQ